MKKLKALKRRDRLAGREYLRKKRMSNYVTETPEVNPTEQVESQNSQPRGSELNQVNPYNQDDEEE